MRKHAFVGLDGQFPQEGPSRPQGGFKDPALERSFQEKASLAGKAEAPRPQTTARDEEAQPDRGGSAPQSTATAPPFEAQPGPEAAAATAAAGGEGEDLESLSNASASPHHKRVSSAKEDAKQMHVLDGN